MSAPLEAAISSAAGRSCEFLTRRKESTRSRGINPFSGKSISCSRPIGASGCGLFYFFWEAESKGNGLPVPIWITGSGQRADKKQVERRIKEHNGICIVSNAEV